MPTLADQFLDESIWLTRIFYREPDGRVMVKEIAEAVNSQGEVLACFEKVRVDLGMSNEEFRRHMGAI